MTIRFVPQDKRTIIVKCKRPKLVKEISIILIYFLVVQIQKSIPEGPLVSV